MTKSSDDVRNSPRILRKVMLALGFMTLALLLSPLGKADDGHKIVSFDAPGADTNPADGLGTYPTAINNWGAITGAYIDAEDVYHGFLRSPDGKFTAFEAPGADTTPGAFNGTTPSTINDLGEIAGNYYDASGFSHGFLRAPNGKFTTFDALGVGGFGTIPIAINLEGSVVGYYTDSNFSFRAFLRTPDGKFKTWIGPGACTGNSSEGCYGSGATNINFFGIIAAGYNDNNLLHHGLVRTPEGKLVTYDVPGAQSTGCPGCSSGLNQWGAIAGIFADTNSVNHGFVRHPDGKFTTFDAPGAGTDPGQGTGCSSDCPVLLNDLGALTGNYIDADWNYHGYLRSPEGKITTIDPLGSTATFPDGINDNGSITGNYYDANGVSHGFLTIPGR